MEAIWSAKWIGPAYDPREDTGVFCFRATVRITTKPEEYLVRLSADQRYRLYVNGEQVIFGPQRGEPRHWFYDVIDIGPNMKAGDNVVAAIVWNFGWMAPIAQMSVRTAFVMEDLVNGSLSTPGQWQVASGPGWDFAMMHRGVGEFYIDVGPGERIDGRHAPSEPWKSDKLEWRDAHVICGAEERYAGYGGTPWMLVPRSIPPMQYRLREGQPLVREDYSPAMEPGKLVLAPGQPLLLDYEELLCAYPRLTLSGPAGTVVSATYDEALWEAGGGKGNRNEVAGKQARGYQDLFTLSNKPYTFEPLWWRTYRYLLLEVQEAPKDGVVVVDRIDAVETGYPLKVESSFEADDQWVKPIWDVSVRTAKRCAGETYFDCPYYEQLQYIGDTRIQAMIGYYLGRDRSLQRNAIDTLAWSMMETGLLQSRYPSRQSQVIPPFSLWWILMAYDQMFYDGHEAFGARFYSIASDIVEGFQRSALEDEGPYWQFCDWVPDWRAGVPPGGPNATVHHLLLWWARHVKFVMMDGSMPDPLGFQKHEWEEEEDEDPRFAEMMQEGLQEDFLPEEGLIRWDMDDDWEPSEHAEALYRMCQQLARMPMSPWPFSALERANAAKCTYYFSYYKHLAMQPDDYMAQLGPWKEMIEDGLTTFAENPEPVRSDCHAWSAHPILGFFQLIAGVTSTAPGWAQADIHPRPGSLRRFDARISHVDGLLRVAYEDGKLDIETPVPARLTWQGKSKRLAPGVHRIG